jgi:hypothetical protein
MGIGQGGDGVIGNTGIRPSLSIQAQKHNDLFCANGLDKELHGALLVSAFPSSRALVRPAGGVLTGGCRNISWVLDVEKKTGANRTGVLVLLPVLL